MYKKILIFFILTPIILVMPYQEKNIPEFFGIYLFANGLYYELNPQEVDYVRPEGNCAEAEYIFGIKSFNVENITDNNCSIIFFLEDIDLANINLTKLKYLQNSALNCRPLIGNSRKIMTRINMWVKDKDIECRVGPVEGKDNMYKVQSREPLEPGVYAIHGGSIRRTMANMYSIYLSEGGTNAMIFTFNFDKTSIPLAKEDLSPSQDKVEKKEVVFIERDNSPSSDVEYLSDNLNDAYEGIIRSRNSYIRSEYGTFQDYIVSSLQTLKNIVNNLDNFEDLSDDAKNEIVKCHDSLEKAQNNILSNKSLISQYSEMKKAYRILKAYLKR